MKSQIKKKLLSLLLAICMVMSLAPTIAFAGGSDPASGNFGEISIICRSQAITGGRIYYKLNNIGDFIQVSEENNRYNSISLTDTDTSIAIKFMTNEGYQLDTTRGVTLRVNRNEAFHSTDTNIADFTSESGYTFNLSELVVDSSLSESSFALEFGFENAGGEPCRFPAWGYSQPI